jgi:hypothetical protein
MDFRNMKTVKLTIAFDTHKAGDVVQFDDRIARHFLAKKWAEEVEKPKKVKK